MIEFGPEAIADKMKLISEIDMQDQRDEAADQEVEQQAVVAAIKKLIDPGTPEYKINKILNALSDCGLPAIEVRANQAILALQDDEANIDKVRGVMATFIK